MRESRVRNGKSDPATSRGTWNGINPITKTTPTVKEKKERDMKKHKKILEYV